MSDTNGTNNVNGTTPAVVTYGGVQDRPNDVNHPDNLAAAATSTDPAAGSHAGPSTPEGYHYDENSDSYVKDGD